MSIINKTNLDKEQFFKLTETIPNKTSLLELLSWGNKKNFLVIDVVKQDEYSLDVILSWSKNLFIVCGTT